MPHTQSEPEILRFHCRHIFTDGRRCLSPALRGEQFCYYHHTTRRPVPAPELLHRRSRRKRCAGFAIPAPEDRSAIQHSIGQVLERIAADEIDSRRAGLLLYGLQIASLNLPKPQPHDAPAPLVEEVTHHQTLGTLAVPAEIGDLTVPGTTQLLIEEYSGLFDESSLPTVHAQQPAAPAARYPQHHGSGNFRRTAPATARLTPAARPARRSRALGV